MNRPFLSIIVPALNEADNIQRLVKRVDKVLKKAGIEYEMVVVDDGSTDETRAITNELELDYPVRLQRKRGKRGKAYSIVEGLETVRGEMVCMIDADLQYPPEAIPAMMKRLKDEQVGVVVANRSEKNVSALRRLASWSFRFVFGRLLHQLKYDVQSGLKVFRKEIGLLVPTDGLTGWTFDLPLLLTALELGYRIDEEKIVFGQRLQGESKIRLIHSSLEIGKQALGYKWTKSPVVLPPRNVNTMLGAGLVKNKKRFVTHTTLEHGHSAVETFTRSQKLTAIALLVVLLAGVARAPMLAAGVLVGVLSVIYFVDVLFNFWLIWKSLHQPPEIKVSDNDLELISDEKLPTYTILCPLYKEAQVLPHFLESIAKIDWPKDKLDVILLLEEDDEETIVTAEKLTLPGYVRAHVVPDSQPKTKPKACNYGLNIAKGELLVIYDAEDIPDPKQLKKVYLAFKRVGSQVRCIQAKLNYHNSAQNLLTRFFTAEYSLWFDVILTGLQTVNTVIPLGGTSNHFRVDDLRRFKGWDSFNVTEDADLGVRLFKNGGRTAIIDSVTLEEANSKLGNWLRQRSRWIKGYMQTYLVHMRHPWQFVKEHRWHAAFFHLSIGGKILFLLINPLMWLLTISYFALYALVGSVIEELYPTAIFYMAAFSLVFGNFAFLYYYMIGVAKRGHWPLMKYVFLVPIYWLAASTAAVIALYQLIVKPHYWEKTVHGLHLNKDGKKKNESGSVALENEVGIEERIEVNTKRSWGLGKGVVSATALVFASVVANVANFGFNAYLGRRLEVTEFGTLSLYGNLFTVLQAVLLALSATVTYKAAFLLGKNKRAAKGFWMLIRKKTFFVSLIMAGLWLGVTPKLSEFFQIGSWWPMLIFTPVWIVGGVNAVDMGFLSGNLKFTALASLVIMAALSKLGLGIGLVEAGWSGWVYVAIPGAIVMVLLPAWWKARGVGDNTVLITKTETEFDWEFFSHSLLRGLATVSFLSLDMILVKHFMSPEDAGRYALISLVGKMIFFVGSLLLQFVTPVISKAEGEARDSSRLFSMILLMLTGVTTLAYLGLGWGGRWSVPILLGDRAIEIVEYLPLYGLAMVGFTVANAVVTYYQVKKVYWFSLVSVFLAVGQLAGIWLFHESLTKVIEVMGWVSLVTAVLSLFLHGLYVYAASWDLNFQAFFGLFETMRLEQQKKAKGTYRFLFLNWRDTKHVWGGGAEVYVHEMAKELVSKGHKVTVFCGNDGNCPRNEVIDGVQMVRRGGFYTVYLWAMIYYVLRFRGKFDVVVDCENGIPFFTPLYVRVPKFLVIHHVHQEIFREHLAWPLALVATAMETKLMPWVYRKVKVITISESSKKAIMRHGLSKREPVVVYSGVDLTKYLPKQKAKSPMVVYVGRLKAYKNLTTLLKAWKLLSDKNLKVKLVIVGYGEELEKLKDLAKNLGIERLVQFRGKVSEKEKIGLYQKAWVAVNPSTMEGWGITSIEANACATPVVASDVPGLRDSVKNPHTGYLVRHNDPHEFADRIFRIISSHALRNDLSQSAQKWAKQFTWKKAVDNLLEVISND